ncbi:MAG: ABC-ATPase domain-containing protein [Candidatus Aminicenantes bacterium]|jgi:predicted ABC-class ATPase
MHAKEDLKRILQRIDGKGYKAYKDIEGSFNFGEYQLFVDRAQGDPFASPSHVRARVHSDVAGFPDETYKGRSRAIALRDYITRAFYRACQKYCRGNRGTGNSGTIAIDRPGQEILERTSAFVLPSWIEARFVVGLPAFGRRIAGRHAESIFFEEIPRIVRAALLHKNLDPDGLITHIKTAEDADALRENLDGLGIVAFVADGAILPRASGIDPSPLTKGKIVPFRSPKSLQVEMTRPNFGPVTGMGIPKGVNLIVGGGYHGKSTLLNALEMGVYNHIPGDGRECVVTNSSAIKIRAEDGRRIEKVDISPFITNLPFGRKTQEFSTEDASGSTSQAANTMEALEAGAQVLLIDEDTSATNFMIRDHRMQELVSKEREPITPFIDKIRQLSKDLGVSTILVIGGSGDYFDVADNVICMVEYIPYDMTQKALEIAEKYKAERQKEGGEFFGGITHRIPLSGSFDSSKGRRDVKIAAKGLKTILFGRHPIDLAAIEQLVDPSQTRALGDAIRYATQFMDGKRTLAEVLEAVLLDIDKKGLDVLSSRPIGDYAEFRGLELAAAINRLRTLAVRQKTGREDLVRS